MSVFDPVADIIQLLTENINISNVNVEVKREWENVEALPEGVDAEVTVGLAEAVDQKLELTGKLRRRVFSFRVNVWSRDRVVRQKTVEEILRVIRLNRKNPCETLDYVDVVGYRDVDRVDVSPFIFRTEIVLKSWVFENLET